MKEIGRFDQGRDVCIYLHGQALAQSLAGEPAEFFRAIAMVRLWPSFMGIGGAVVGGLLTRSVGFGYGGTIITTLVAMIDRKSTRLNSSHVAISYAVFCLKKKKIKH